MTRLEQYMDEHMEVFAEYIADFYGVNKETDVIDVCNSVGCESCKFDKMTCSSEMKKWLLEEVE